jgi:hypothetical protein
MHSDAQLTLFSSFSLGKGNKPQWLVLPKDKEVQQRWDIVVDIAGTLSK